MLLKAQSEAENAVKVFEMRIRLQTSAPEKGDKPNNQREIDAFVLLNQENLESSDLNLLSSYYQPISVIEEYLALSRSAAQRWLKKNNIEGVKIEGNKAKLYPSIEIVKAINGETD